MPVRTVVFDLDGTLVDSMPLVLRAYAHALRPYCPPMTEEELVARLGGPPDRLFEELLPGRAEVDAALQRLRDYSLENWKQIQPFAGMKEMTAEVARAGIAIGIWTGRERESAEWILRESGLDTRVQACVFGDDLPSHKPDPAGLAEVLRRLGTAPAEAVFVGDADVDVLAGSALGVRTVLICHHRNVPDAVKAKAWRAVGTPADAYRLLDAVCREKAA